MEIVRFLAWWWKNLDAGKKVIILFVFWISVAIANIFLFSFQVAALVFYAGLGIFFSYIIIKLIYKSINQQWRTYNYEKDREAQKIVNKLRGYR